MPTRPKRRCSYPMCGAYVTGDKTRCAKHGQPVRDGRASSSERGYDSRWQKIRLLQLRSNPLCHDCMQQGRIYPAGEVHHIKKLSAGGTNEDTNLMSLCRHCHQVRTNRGE